MSARAARAVAALVLFAMTFASGPLFAQGTAAVRGRVVDSDTGLPLRRVTIALRHVDQKEGGQSAVTDAEGAFAFEAVPAGRYRLSASKTRYVDQSLGARAPGRPGRAFDLAEGQELQGLTIRLALAGVIAGRVLDDAGEPISNATVMALRQRGAAGAARLTQTMHARSTDDTGAYRLFGLPPGRYFLSVRAGHEVPRAHGLLDTSGSAFAPTYYPSTPVASEAQPIDVAAGVDAFADIALVPTRVTSVTGEVVDAAGRPARIGFVHLMPAGQEEGGDASGWLSGHVREGGGFTLSSVPPGDYTLSVQAFFGDDELMRMMATGSMQGSAYKVPLTVSGDSITDLRVVVPPPVEVAGRVLFDGEPPGGGTPAVTVFAASGTHGEMGGPRTPVGADGRFTLRMLPGPWRFAAFTPGRWMPKRLTFRGRAVPLDAAVEVDTEPGARLEIVLTSQLTVVTGTASDAEGNPVLDYHVVVFPAAPGPPPAQSWRTRTERADAQGRFRLEGLLPGEYLVAALADYEPNEQPIDEELLDTVRPGAARLRLGEGATESVSLKVSPAP
jgi:protocatechuate 3,4-dioxygenase beta subunit